ncbi:MAG TPA: hypothetical protein VNI01_09710 [Elusimicrobiota bacterium]|jgi:hypothetical protein|nr:hypothetical protein [Elusimicrobiota bacterium]
MPRRALRLLVIASLLLATGAHWAVLQSAAWAGMLLSRSRTQTLARAAGSTFDGRHPCGVCLKVRRGAGAPKGQAARLSQPREDLFFAPVSFRLPPRRPLWTLATATARLPEFLPSFETPPPRPA